MERHEWEAIAIEVASMIDVHTGPLLALDRVRFGHTVKRARPTRLDSMERDFWRGWIAWVAPVECAAYADACVHNEDAYAAGALARMLHDDELLELQIEIRVRETMADLAEEIGGGARSEAHVVSGPSTAAEILACDNRAIRERFRSVFACVRCGTASGPHHSCECGANEPAPWVVEVTV